MNDTSTTSPQPASTIPPDDPQRNLAIARPNEDQNLPHIGLVGDTYTILLTGKDTDRKSTRLKLQSPCTLVCRLLLEKKKKKKNKKPIQQWYNSQAQTSRRPVQT